MKEYNKYEGIFNGLTDMEEDLKGIAENSLKAVEDYELEYRENLGIEKNVDKLKEIIGTDLRSDVSPRIYSLISGMVSIIEEIERE